MTQRVLAVGEHRVALEDELGRGGMGAVYRGRLEDGRAVAVKLLYENTEKRRRRFEREVRALSTLEHPSVVGFVAASEGPPACLIMELVEGESLAQLLGRGRPSFERTARVVADAASGTAAAHALDFIHRDLKPANILIRRSDGRALVTDFGVAKDLLASLLTQAGTPVGTCSHMAPEQVKGDASFPSDVWALGIILYQGLTGAHPFEKAASTVELMAAIASGPIVWPRERDPDVPEALDAICRACLARDPALRPKAAELERRLRAWKAAPVARSARAARLAIPLAIAIAATTTWMALRARPTLEATGTPWPGLPRGKVTASLALGPAPEARPRALWPIEGRLADPLAAPAHSFLGEVSDAGGSRLRVRYDLARALRPRATEPLAFFATGDARTYLVEPRGAGIVCEAANDAGSVVLALGASVWSEPRVDFRIKAKAIDMTAANVRLGGSTLTLAGRQAVAKIGSHTVPFAFTEKPQKVRFAPGAPPGERVLIAGEVIAALDAEARAPGTGTIAIELLEGEFELDELVVEGKPRKPDVAATAVFPGELAADASIAASFLLEKKHHGGAGESDAIEGGPFVALGRPGASSLVLALEGARLELRHGDRKLAGAALGAAPERGRLELERSGEVVRGRASIDGHAFELEAADPIPLARAPRAFYGSTGPAVRFESATVESGAIERERAALDDALGEGAGELARRALALPTTRPEAAWRRGAILLATVTELELADRSLLPERPLESGQRGAWLAARAARIARAAEARSTLEAAALRGLAPIVRRDALARGVVAAAVAEDGEAAARLARRLVDDAGPGLARALVDGVLRDDRDRPHLVDWLVNGDAGRPYDADLAAAELGVAAVIAPDRRGEVLFARGRIALNRKPDPRTESGRAAIERAIDAFDEAASAGADAFAIGDGKTEAYLSLGELDRAFTANEGLLALRPGDWFLWQRRGSIASGLGRDRDALESLLGALAFAPSRGAVRATVEKIARDGRSKAGPGLRAAALVALASLAGDAAARDDLREAALALASNAPDDDDRRDLATGLYALVVTGEGRGGESVVIPRDGQPALALARARRSPDTANLAELKEAAKRDPLVLHLALLDPSLERAVR